jgi:histidine triad (HIT) family protein
MPEADRGDARGDPDCLFCKMVAGEIPCDKVYEDGAFMAFRDIHPQAPLHVLVIPKTHIATLDDVGPAQTGLIGAMFPIASMVAEKDGRANDGYRVVFNCRAGAGQSVFHVHMHVLGGRPMNWPPG